MFVTLMEQWGTVQDSISTSLNSSGSAMAENEKYLNSLEGKVNNVKSAFEQLATTTINSDFVKGILDFTASALKLVDSLGGLVPVLTTILGIVVSIKSASIASWVSGLITMVSGAITPLKMLTTGMLSAKNAMLMLNASMMANPAGMLVAGIGAAVTVLGVLGGAMVYASKEGERLEAKIKDINAELSSNANTHNQASAIAEQYESLRDLADAQGLSNEQQEEYTRIQNELKAVMPSINGYYDEQGNFIVTQKEVLSALNEEYAIYLDNKKKEKAEAAKGLSGERLEGLKKEYEYQENALKQLEELKKRNQDERAFSSGAVGQDDRTVAEVVEGIEKSINDSKNRISEHAKKMQSDILNVASATEEWGNLTTVQSNAIRRFISEQDVGYLEKYEDQIHRGVFSVEEFVSTLLKEESVIKSVTDMIKDNTSANNENAASKEHQVKTSEEYGELLDELIKKHGDYKSMLDELNEANGLSAKTISSIAKEYPELLGYMDDEETLRAKLIELIAKQEQDVNDAYKDMIVASEEYYNARIIGDEKMYSALTGAIGEYFNNLGTAYKGDLKNYQTLEQAKAKTTEDLIKQLAGAWSKYYNVTAKSVTLDSSFIDQYGAHGTHMYGAYKYLEEAKDFQKQFQSIADTINIDPINIDFTGGGNKNGDGSGKDTIADEFRKQLNEISKLREDKEREIAELQEAINLDELLGEYDPNKANKMTVLKDELRGISEIQIGKFEGLAKLYKDTEQLGELESLIADARKQDLIDEQTYMQHIIDLTNQKYETEKRSYDDKVREIELQQALVKEGSEAHILLEQEKLDLLLQMQQSHLENVRQLKATGLSQESEEVRKYVDMYYDAEMEILNMQKAMAEQARAAKLETISKQIDQYEEQKKAQQDIFEMTMKMIKAEHEARKKALQDEIKGYEKIINKKKEALRDEYDKENANEELEEKQKLLSDIESQLLMLEGVEGEDAKARRIKLEEEKAKAIKDIDKFNREQLLQSQEDMLDKELENFKDKKEEEIGEIEDYLSKEGNIRDEALRRMDKKNKELYEQLKKYSNEYSTVSGEEFDKLWQTANQSIDGYTNKNMTLLDAMKLVTRELEKQQQLYKDTQESSWQSNVPSGNVGGSQTNSNVKTIQQMMANSNKWSSADANEKERLAAENAKLGSSIGAYYDSATGVWYTDSSKKTKLYDSVIGTYHKGGIVGGNTSLKSTEEFAKLLKGEVVASIPQIDNFMNKTLPRIANGGGSYNINLSIDKLIDVDKLDGSVDVESITKRAIDGVMKNLNNGFRSKGLRPSF